MDKNTVKKGPERYLYYMNIRIESLMASLKIDGSLKMEVVLKSQEPCKYCRLSSNVVLRVQSYYYYDLFTANKATGSGRNFCPFKA